MGLTKTAMPMENVLVNPMLLVTNVMLSYQAIMTLMIQKNVIATWMALKMKLVIQKEDATACMCDEHGSVDDECDATTGKCTCKENFANDKCSECIEGFFGFPNCQGCTCNAEGSETA